MKKQKMIKNILEPKAGELMKIFVSVKQVGKKKAYLSDLCYEIHDSPLTLTELIRLIVTERVKVYNAKTPDSDIVALLTQEDIDAQAQTGKVGFGRRFNSKNADPQKAVDVALLAFTDGLYRVFIDEREIETLDEHLEIREGSKITFIRLTFLSGRMW
jgi:uncharacterized LabA/DUF88 family protein